METNIHFDKVCHEGSEIVGDLEQNTMEESLNGNKYTEERNFYDNNSDKHDQNSSLNNHFKQTYEGNSEVIIGNHSIGMEIRTQNEKQDNIEIEKKENNYYTNNNIINVQQQQQLNSKKKASEWRNELLSFPHIFNQVFLSLNRFNDYIDQRWSLLNESHNKLYNLLLELSKTYASINNSVPHNIDNIFFIEKSIHNKYVSLKSKIINHHQLNYFRVTNIYIPGTELNSENIARENEFKMRLYEELYNKFQTCKNDIEITFERKSEMVTQLDSRVNKIVSSIEKFINNNQYLLESHTKPLYNIDSSEICEIGIVKRKTGVRGRPPGSGNRGRPPGSTKKAKKDPQM
ncbi:hypothetical protein [Cryptosporidium parvum Iowa II]|uniref:Uncharacterized protein n=2 Tax=Cryptosporidium parvum TaxID=5807 RepID=Q5CSC5_CRYPI|nr:hypothetical protein [Cryptosporidium parvum Iowa II]EAK88323.1 hypothetical protein cgd1_3260 [Cryptosporidium parvum Iowa II]QOY43298.1 Uncharacterized protein CPATCC_0036030 [Cryptosporidium parvum]WKS76231.1 hypothetical protein CPCDC_1g3260 [Cryptosporidium sp. 43IA8]WRK30723.1 Uncharacterized protein cpbgf_1003260 [Cryptosporidium parvum]|eukprot:QOY43298.1 hypothetical protein CPATCC_000072 [Cryptosporidium parvum]